MWVWGNAREQERENYRSGLSCRRFEGRARQDLLKEAIQNVAGKRAGGTGSASGLKLQILVAGLQSAQQLPRNRGGARRRGDAR